MKKIITRQKKSVGRPKKIIAKPTQKINPSRFERKTPLMQFDIEGDNNENKLRDLVSSTAKIADNKAEAQYERGKNIEAQMMLKDAPPVGGTVTEVESGSTLQAPSGTIPVAVTEKTNKTLDPDTLPQSLNALLPLVATALKKDASDVMYSKEQLEAMRDLMPEGGGIPKSWWLYAMVLLTGGAGNILQAKNKNTDVPIDQLITAMQKMGYRIEKDVDPKVLAELEALGYEVKKKHSEVEKMISELSKQGYTITRTQIVTDEKISA